MSGVLRRQLPVVHEVAVTRRRQQFERKSPLLARVLGQPKRLLNQGAGLAASQRDAARPEVLREQAFDERPVERHLRGCAVVREDPQEVLARRAFGEHLVLDAPQERLVDQFSRLQVRGKHNEHDKREVELLPGLERQVVHTALERNDPAVQEIPRASNAAGRSRQ